MASKFQFDKKQLPQVIALGVMSLGCFGYFGSQMLAPTATNAAGAPATPAAPAAAAAAKVAHADSQIATNLLDSPPAPSMRDPFLISVSPVDPDAAPPPVAPSLNAAAPLPRTSLASLPSMTNVQPLPSVVPYSLPVNPMVAKANAAKAAVAELGWTVSGVVAPEGNPNGGMAVLRSGEQRSFVRIGSRVAGVYTVTAITHTGVILKRPGQVIHLVVGAVPPPPPTAPPAASAVPAAATAPGQPAAPTNDPSSVITGTKGLGALPL